MLVGVSPSGLEVLFCRRFHCDNAEFEQRAFRQCLYWHARLLAPLLRWVRPGFFDKDLKFIRYLGAATNWEEAKVDINNFCLVNIGEPSLSRQDLRLRVSGRKASRLARELLSPGIASAGTTIQNRQNAPLRLS
jgi:hypothetical protein